MRWIRSSRHVRHWNKISDLDCFGNEKNLPESFPGGFFIQDSLFANLCMTAKAAGDTASSAAAFEGCFEEGNLPFPVRNDCGFISFGYVLIIAKRPDCLLPGCEYNENKYA